MAKGDSTKLPVGSNAAFSQVPTYKLVPFDLSFAAADTYKTGGFTINPAEVGMSTIAAVICLGIGYHAAWRAPNLQLFRQNAGTGALQEVPDATDVSASSPMRCLAVGY